MLGVWVDRPTELEIARLQWEPGSPFHCDFVRHPLMQDRSYYRLSLMQQPVDGSRPLLRPGVKHAFCSPGHVIEYLRRQFAKTGDERWSAAADRIAADTTFVEST